MSTQATNNEPASEPAATTTTLSAKHRVYFAIRFIAQPMMFLAAGLALLAALGVAQRAGWISAGGPGDGGSKTTVSADVDYICPMMCTPPQKEPGRCPVCAMELVPASGSNSSGDERSVIVDAATRRVANIQTASVQRISMHRQIRAVGEIAYDEGNMKTISAYTDGRFDKMYVDYTGAVVKKGDRLAEFYSPDLYSAQVEYLQANDAMARPSSIAVVSEANQRLQSGSQQRLIEFGMSEAQIVGLARDRKALNRLDIVAPIHGTVIERLAVEGQYVKQGEPVFRLADLSTVWLMLELFPEDASAVRLGQSVDARLKSMPDRTFTGRIAFINPEVNQQSRTVSVRVVLENAEGLIRIGDYAKASIDVPIVLRDRPPADQPDGENFVYVVPRSAVLSAANQSVLYVETETGRFEIRRVVTGPTSGENIVIVKGVAEGEKVATAGNFLLDSQMQLAGNPSLIDPFRAAPALEMIVGFTSQELAEIEQLANADRSLAIKQIICPVTEYKLGSMGVPPKVDVNGETIFICCEACRADVVAEPVAHLAKLEDYRINGPAKETQDDAFEVPVIGEIREISPAEGAVVGPSDGSGGFELPKIESIDASESFEIEVPDFDSSVERESVGGSQ